MISTHDNAAVVKTANALGLFNFAVDAPLAPRWTIRRVNQHATGSIPNRYFRRDFPMVRLRTAGCGLSRRRHRRKDEPCPTGILGPVEIGCSPGPAVKAHATTAPFKAMRSPASKGDWNTAMKKWCEQLLGSCRTSNSGPRPEKKRAQPRIETGHRAGPRFVQDESSVRPRFPRMRNQSRDAFRVPSNCLRRGTPAISGVRPRANTRFDLAANARNLLEDKSHRCASARTGPRGQKEEEDEGEGERE